MMNCIHCYVIYTYTEYYLNLEPLEFCFYLTETRQHFMGQMLGSASVRGFYYRLLSSSFVAKGGFYTLHSKSSAFTNTFE